jgi:polar amino acid transport system substrate-binding protein
MIELNDAARAELLPTGVLRIAIAVGAARSALWAALDEKTGLTAGITVDLGNALGARLQVPYELVVHSSSGHIVEQVDGNVWDVTFVPVDAERKARMDFGPDYYLGDSTYLVHADSGIEKVADMDRENLTIVGVEGTATLRSARRTSRAKVIGLSKVSEALELFQKREADGIALGRESLQSLNLPNTRILPDHFHATGTAVAVPKGRPLALAVVSSFIEDAKADGTLRSAFDRNGMGQSAVAPIGSRS